ncbi:MAG: YcjX family protein [Magnetococcales bacterium]|nr:YcjX family protein [Magnetococcales bacterium]
MTDTTPFAPLGMLLASAQKTLTEWLHLAMDQTVRLAVTGLNQSGKTVFITALVHQLLHARQDSGLPFFECVSSNRFAGSRVMMQPDVDVSAFRYDQFIQPLTQQRPSWPTRTDELSEIRLAIRFQPTGLIHRQLSDASTLYLDIIDYPGEWLLDLPMLELSYAEWSAQIFQSCMEEPRRTLSTEWRTLLQSMEMRKADDALLRQASGLYTQFLMRCKLEYGLSLLQPGRFTVPGELKGTPLLTFCPLPDCGEESRGPESVYSIMEERFNAYKERVVYRFYKDHFSRFDRQIVLIDLLKALSKGPENFSDMRVALESILRNFHYGTSGLLSRLLWPKIDKLLFVATKVDHVAANQHHNLERLLNRIVNKPANDAIFQGVEVKTMALSSVTCTRTVVREHDGRRLSFVQGIPKGRNKEILLFPGEIPESLPRAEDWDANRFNFMEFEPPRLIDPEAATLPHIRLDQALQFLLGDKLS